MRWSGRSGATPVDQAVAPIAERVDSLSTWNALQQAFPSYDPSGLSVLNTLAEVRFGDGVWIRVTAPIDWVQPAATGRVS